MSGIDDRISVHSFVLVMASEKYALLSDNVQKFPTAAAFRRRFAAGRHWMQRRIRTRRSHTLTTGHGV